MEESEIAMPHVDIFGRTIPTVNPGGVSDGPANIQTALEAYSATSGGMINVASDAEANSIATTAPEGTSFPLHFWNTTKGAHLIKETRTTPLEQVGGKQHGLISSIGHNSLNPGTAWLIRHTTIAKASEGWGVDASGSYLTVPVGGLYLVQLWGRTYNATTGENQADLGGQYAEFVIDGNTQQLYRDFTVNGSMHKAQMVVEVPEDGRIATRFVHNAPNAIKFEGEFTAVQLNSPRWV